MRTKTTTKAKRDVKALLHTVGEYAVIGYATAHLILTLGENLLQSVGILAH